MSGGDPTPGPSQRLLTLRIIHGALLIGCAGFGVVAVLLRQQGRMPPRAGPPVVSYAGFFMAAMMAVLFFVVPASMVAAWRRRMAGQSPAPSGPDGDSAYWVMLQAQFVVGAALLEGTIFMNLCAYLLEREPWSLGIAAAFFLCLAAQFPTESGVRRWTERQREAIEQLRREGVG